MTSIRPTRITTRQFHIHVEKEGKSLEFDVNIEHEAMQELREQDSLRGTRPNGNERSTQEKEYDVIRSIVERAFESEVDKSKSGSFSIDVSKSGAKGPIRAKISGGKKAEGYYEVEVSPTVVAEIQDGNIVQKPQPWSAIRAVETTNHETMLQRFSQEKKFTGRFAKTERLVHQIFAKLAKQFQFINRLWKQITNRPDMPWSQDALATLCTFPSGKEEEIPLADALAYIGRLTKNSEPNLSKRLRDASKLAKDPKKPEHLKKLNKQLAQLSPSTHSEDAIFIPVKNMLCRVSRDQNGYNVEVLNSPDTIGNYTIDKEKNLFLKGLSHTEVMDIAKKRSFPQGKNFEMQDVVQERGALGLVSGAASRSFKGGDSDYAKFALKVRLFVDMCQESEQWLKDPDFREHVQQTCYQILDDCEQELGKIGISERQKDTELGEIEREVAKILQKTAEVLPSVDDITGFQLEELGSSHFPPVKRLHPVVTDLVPKELTPDRQVEGMATKGAARSAVEITKAKLSTPSAPDALRREMKDATLCYAGGTIIDASAVQPSQRARTFPQLTSDALGLSSGEQLALIYTAHSQDSQANGVAGLADKAETETFARAVYTLQALIDHPKLGRSEEIQGLLSEQLFKQGRLDTLLKTKESTRVLKKCLVTLYERGTLLTEVPRRLPVKEVQYQSGLFLLRLATQIDYYAKQKGTDLEQPDVLAGLTASIARYGGAVSDRLLPVQRHCLPEFLGMTHDQIAMGQLNVDAISDLQLGDLLTACRYCHISPPASKHLRDKIEQLKPLIYSLAKEKIEAGSHDSIKRFLGNINSEIAGETIEWDATSFPVLKGQREGQTIQVDVVTGDLFAGSQRISLLPKEAAEHADVQRLFPKAAQLLWVVESSESDPGTIVYSLPEDKTIRIVQEAGDALYIEKQIPSQTEEPGEWAVYKYYPSQKSIAEGKPIADNPDDLPEKVAQAIGSKSCWQSRESDTIYALEKGNKEIYATFRQTEGASRLTLANGQTLLEPDGRGLTRYVSLETEGNLLLYGEQGQVAKIEYPHLRMSGSGAPLSYQISDEGVAKTPLFEGWTLSPQGKRPGWHKGQEAGDILPPALPPGFTSFHLLETQTGQQKILLTNRRLQKTTTTKTKTTKGTYRTETTSLPGKERTTVYEYTLDPETNRLCASSAEAYLHLAYVCFAHKEYSSALFYMKRANSSTGDTDQFHEITSWIQEWSDSSENSKAAQLRLLCFGERVRRKRKIEQRQKTKTTTAKAEVLPLEESPYKTKMQTLYNAEAKLPAPLALSEEDGVLLTLLGIKEGSKGERAKRKEQIEALERELKSGASISSIETLQAVSVAKQTGPVVGKAYFAKTAASYFTTKEHLPDEVSTKFFDTIIASKKEDPRTRGLAQEHLEDFQTAQKKTTTTATITEKNAQKLQKDLSRIHQEQVKNKEAALKTALAILEKIGGAGASARKRALGEEETATIESLIQIWRSGALLTEAGKGKVDKIAKRKLSPAEIEQIDWAVTQYMTAVADLRHIERAQSAATSYLSSFTREKKGDPALGQKLFEWTSTGRHFALYTKPEDISLTDISSLIVKNPEVRELICKKIDFCFKDDKPEAEKAKAELLLLANQGSDVRVKELLEGLKYSKEIETDLLKNSDTLRFLCQHASDKDYREFLSIEHACSIILRESQVHIVREMLSSPNAVRQLGMGGGKSKVLLPLLAKMKAKGHNLVGILLPEALYETNRRDLDNTNRALFGQEMFCFEYNRFSALGGEELEKIYYTLQSTIKSRGFIATTRSSLLSFRNAYNELTKSDRVATTVEKEKIEAMAKILTIFKERTDLIADEVDLILDVRKEVNSAVGERQPIATTKVDVGLECMKTIFSQDIKGMQELQEHLKNNSQAQISKERREELLRKIADTFLKHNEVDASEEMLNYLQGKASTLPAVMKTYKENNLLLYQKIASLKAFLNRGFGSTLGKTCLVDYGRDPTPIPGNEPFTIPFKASNSPARGSEFDDDIERISYTLADYAYKDVEQSLVQNCIRYFLGKMDTQYKQAKKDNPQSKYTETAAYQQFEGIIQSMDPEGKLGLDTTLLNYADDTGQGRAVKKLTTSINSSPLARVVFCGEYTMKIRMHVFPEQISSKADDLADMVHGFGGFTGTPWCRRTFHDKIQTKVNLGVDGNTYSILLRKKPKIKTMPYDPAKPLTSFKDFSSQGYKALIDTGAYLRGIDNVKFIQQALETAEEGTLGIYYDAGGTLVGQKKGGEPIPLDQISEEDLEKRITLYDQAHTVGADVRQSPTAVAALTIGEHTTTRDLFQAVWRLRQIDREQEIEFLISEPMKALIMKKVGKSGEPTIEDILAFCLKNQAKSEAEVNFRAELTKIKLKGPQVMFDHLVKLGKEGAWDQLQQCAKAYKPHLTKKRDQNKLYEEYAAVTQEVAPEIVLDKVKKKTKEALKETAQKEGVAKEALERCVAQLDKRKPLPKDWVAPKVASGAGDIANVAEAEAEVEVAVEQYEIQEEEEVEIAAPPIRAAKGGGKTQITGAPVTHESLNQLIGPGDKDTLCVGDRPPFRKLANIVDVFDKRFFIGSTYEGRMPKDIAPVGGTDPARTQTILHQERLPINEALFIRDQKSGWKVVFGSTHDSYPSFSSYPGKHLGTPAALVMIGAGGPISLKQNDAFKDLDEGTKKEFIQLYAQLKFFKGEFQYSKEELAALRTWINAHPKKSSLRNLFENTIRATKSVEDQQGYSQSPLRNLFDSMGL